MRIHAIQTGTVAVKARQREGTGRGPLRLLNTLRDEHWTKPLPILAWLIEHPEGLIVVDTGETALRERLVILAGDTSYTEQLMLDGTADGVTNDPTTAKATLTALRTLAQTRPTVYLPSHDPASQDRLAAMQIAAPTEQLPVAAAAR